MPYIDEQRIDVFECSFSSVLADTIGEDKTMTNQKAIAHFTSAKAAILADADAVGLHIGQHHRRRARKGSRIATLRKELHALAPGYDAISLLRLMADGMDIIEILEACQDGTFAARPDRHRHLESVRLRN